MPEPKGREMMIVAYADVDLAGCKLTRRSRTGFIIYINQAPIYWFSKKQNGVETATFNSKFLAMKTCCEYIRGLQYKLRMVGIPVSQPEFIYGDNKSVLNNTTTHESTLHKKSTSIAYHFIREEVTKDEWIKSYIKSDENCSDTLTKTVPAGRKRKCLVSDYLYDIYEEQ